MTATEPKQQQENPLLDGLQLQSLLEPGTVDSERVLEEIMRLLGAT